MIMFFAACFEEIAKLAALLIGLARIKLITKLLSFWNHIFFIMLKRYQYESNGVSTCVSEDAVKPLVAQHAWAKIFRIKCLFNGSEWNHNKTSGVSTFWSKNMPQPRVCQHVWAGMWQNQWFVNNVERTRCKIICFWWNPLHCALDQTVFTRILCAGSLTKEFFRESFTYGPLPQSP